MTLWIRIDANIGENPNVWKLAEVRGLSAVACVGHLVMLFGNVAEHAPSGDISGVPDALLERWAGWTGEAGLFAQSFKELFVNDGIVDGWEKRQGKLIERAQKERERAARRRSEEGTRTVRGQSADESAARNGTLRKKKEPSARAGDRPADRATWLTPYFEAWKARFGGNPTSPGEFAKYLRPLHDEHGEPETVRRWTIYLTRSKPDHANPSRFASTFGSWTDAPPDAQNGAPRVPRATEGLIFT